MDIIELGEDRSRAQARLSELKAQREQTKGADSARLEEKIRAAQARFDDIDADWSEAVLKASRHPGGSERGDGSDLPPARSALGLAGGEYVPADANDPDGSGYLLGAKSLRFERDGLAELHKAANNRGIKAITATSAPQSNVPAFDMTAFPVLRDKTRLLDYIPSRDTTSPRGTYFRATTAADQAAPVAAGANKPESSPVWESVDWKAEKIAHWGKAHDEVVADWDGFLQMVGEEFIAGLIDEETDQLLNGSGTTPQLRGILNTSGIQNQAWSANIVETAAKAATKLRTGSAKCEPDLFVFNADDWLAITLFRTGGSTATDGPFLVNPLTSPALELWGTPVVVTTRLASGQALAANMKLATRAEIRQAPSLEVAPGTGEAEWKANITLIRAEERLALKVPRPAAIVTFDTADPG